MQNEIGVFLRSRRSRLAPEDVGLPRGSRRRVPGLRREEVAELAGISVDYYVQIERGRAPGVSDDVVAALARALRLTEDEASYFHARARASAPAAVFTPEMIPQTVKSLLDAITGVPAVVYNRRLDMVEANPLGAALYAPVYEFSVKLPNLARHVFLDPRAGGFYPDWDTIAEDTAALLRRGLPGSEELVEELLDSSEGFRVLGSSSCA